jgi:hypothetical protein
MKEAAFVKNEAFKFGLIGALIVFAVTTILAKTGLAASFGEDEDILFFCKSPHFWHRSCRRSA